MKEILVTIFVLPLNQEFDLFLPINIKVQDALQLIQTNIVELSDGNYVVNPQAMLYSEVAGKIINPNNIVKYSGLKNGCKVLLK
ncbi:MAG: hypothetical protein E7160_03055 [Firmicutes bacterium]|nr:hypothetical protein [Bacillota bacterium]